MTINQNVFYVASEKINYICWEKIPEVKQYDILRDGKLICSYDAENKQILQSERDDIAVDRPYEFDNDHHTELFKPATRNWLYFKDRAIQSFQKYIYQFIGRGGSTSEEYSAITQVYTE